MLHDDNEVALFTRRWLKGIPYEVAFWQSYYRNKRSRADLFEWSLYGRECVLDNFDLKTFIEGCGDDQPVIADVGCALSYTFGGRIGGRDYPVQYIDPLAPFYNHILDRYHIDRPRIIFGMTESLSDNFRPDSVAFLHIRNSLDHSMMPVLGIREALRVLKPGGVLYLNHFRNEAENENYRGFHQFNISEENGHLVIWDRRSRYDINDMLHGIADVTVSVTDSGRIVAVIRKTGTVPPEWTDTPSISRAMTMATAEAFHSASFALSYQLGKLKSQAGHTVMRLLPTTAVQKLKRLLGRH